MQCREVDKGSVPYSSQSSQADLPRPTAVGQDVACPELEFSGENTLV